MHHTVAPTATLVREMVEATGRDNVKVNLDTGHAFINGGLEEEFTVLKDHIVHVHLNDGRTSGVRVMSQFEIFSPQVNMGADQFPLT